MNNNEQTECGVPKKVELCVLVKGDRDHRVVDIPSPSQKYCDLRTEHHTDKSIAKRLSKYELN
jgi:hypothetical protein